MSKRVKRNTYLTYGHRHDFGSAFKGAAGGLNMKSLGKGVGGGIGAIGSAAGDLIGGAIGGGYQSGAGDVFNKIGDIGSKIPGPWGAIIGGGAKVLGGVVNAAFGSKVDQEKLNAANEGTATLNSFKSNAESFDDIKGVQAVANVQDAYKGGWFAKGSARRKNEELRRQRAQAMSFADRSIENNIENLAEDQMNDMLSTYAAFGGPLHTNGADWNTGITVVDNGGSHESNPLEGVPMGMAPDGTPNLVEEGEVIFNDYVFSKRLKVPKAVREKYKLRGTKDLTFADAAKKAQKESEERPNDPISKRGLEAAMKGLMYEQEQIRQKREERRAKQAMFAYGGPFGHIFQGKGIQPQQMFPSSKGGIFNEEDYNPAMIREANFAKNTRGKRKDYMTRSRELRNRVPVPPTVGNYTVYLPKESKESKASYQLLPDYSIGATGNGNNMVNLPNYLLRPDDSIPFYLQRPEEGPYGIYFNYGPQPSAFTPSAAPNRKATTTATNTNVGTTAASVTSPSSAATTKRRAATKVTSKVTPTTTNTTQTEQIVTPVTTPITPVYGGESSVFKEQSGYNPWTYGLQEGTPQVTQESLSPLEQIAKDKTANRLDGRTVKVTDNGTNLDLIPKSDVEELDLTGSGHPNDNGWWDASYLRYAPVLGAGLGVFTDLMGWTNKPDYSDAEAIKAAADSLRDVSFTPIGDYMKYTPFDRMFYANQLGAQAGATRRNIMNTSGGNRGVAMAGLLGADYNAGTQLGNLYRQAEEYNLGQRQKVAEFNRGTNQFNAENDLKAQIANIDNNSNKVRAAIAAAELKDKINARTSAARSANLTNLFDSIGDIGREAYSRNMILSNPALYYSIDRTGRVHYKNGYENLSDDEKAEVQSHARYSIYSQMQPSKGISLVPPIQEPTYGPITIKSGKKEKNGGYITIKSRRRNK